MRARSLFSRQTPALSLYTQTTSPWITYDAVLITSFSHVACAVCLCVDRHLGGYQPSECAPRRRLCCADAVAVCVCGTTVGGQLAVVTAAIAVRCVGLHDTLRARGACCIDVLRVALTSCV